MTTGFVTNPITTSVAAGTFGVQWEGGFQGTAQADPAARYALAGGVLDVNETLPMWGGVGIGEYIGGATGNPVNTMGSAIKRATTLANLMGFSTFDQAHGMVITQNSPVPLAVNGMQVNFYRFGSGIRLWLAAAANLSFAAGTAVNTAVSWDLVNQQVVPYLAAYAQQSITGTTYTTGTGAIVITVASGSFATTGSWIAISGYVNTAAQLNGSYQVTAQSSTTITLQGPVGLTVVGGDLTAGTPIQAAGGGALPIKDIVGTSFGTSMTVVYNSTTGYGTWNRSGNAILALL